MKYQSIIYVIIVFFLSCKQNKSSDVVCIKSFEYEHQKYRLAPDGIVIKFNDKNQSIVKKLKTDWITEIIFFDSKLKDARFGDGHLRTSNDSVVLQISTGYFSPEIKKKVWISKEVEKLLLKDSIGLIYKKDTLIIRRCK